MVQPIKHCVSYLATAASVWAVSTAPASAADFGQEVVNVAQITYTSGLATTTVETNAAIFTIEPPRVPAVIEFFRHSPNASNPIFRQINGSDFSPTGSLSGPFTNVGEPSTAGGSVLDLSSEIPLIPAETYLSGELMFIRVIDTGRNTDSNAIDTVEITVTASNGDEIVLQLYESGPDTGEFWAYILSSADGTPVHDRVLTTGNNTRLTATYIDIFDQRDVTVDTALVDPYGVVFDSTTGEPVDGARVTLIDVTTGAEADVFGVDGFSGYPSSVVSGSGATDDSGLVYDVDPGEFRFPLAAQGQYFVRVEPPEGYNFASVLPRDQLVEINDDYVIIDASFGQNFTLEGLEPLRFDIPLDPESDLVISKTADRSTADVGDFVMYTVTVDNNGQVATPVSVHDTLPLGFRYVQGTSRREITAIADPSVSDEAGLLTFPMGVIAPGDSISLSYALEVGPGAPLGDAVNEAVVRDGDGDQISNVARAGIKLREDLLRSRTTIVGRITEQSCDGDEEWARHVDPGIGVEGVRVYTETGAYAVSDASGLFHFEGVKKGTHVVQIDEETLPQGFEPMFCEVNSRYAGSATSKFVDAQGGGIWRANFYLKQTGEVAQDVEVEMFNDTTEYKDFDLAWLDTQTAEPAWVYPQTDRTPSKPSINAGIKHAPDEKVELSVNGVPVSNMNLAALDGNTARDVFISRWRGIDLLEGRNEFVAVVRNASGQIVKTLNEEISYVTTIARAAGVPDQSELVADGRAVPIMAIRLEDEAGRPVHAGRITTIQVESPYRLYSESRENILLQEASDLVSPSSNINDLSIGPDGILRVQLEPTLRTGKVTVIVTLDNGREVPIYMYMEPEKRDWILVGLAEGSAGLQNVKSNGIDLGSDAADDLVTDGRVAFFAKGLIKGNWLMTMAVDTDKRRGDRDGAFQDEIDPNAYYTLYGDRSYQEYEGISRYPVFVKLEKRTAYAMFGDFNTNITEGRLTAYSRQLSGLKGEYLGDNIQVLGFAAETNQGFAKDELAANGTSGDYQLSNSRILPQSEQIVVETRDRNRSDVIVESRTLVRYLDYTLDYYTGELIFRLPVDATDFDFNPNVIVVDYETSEDAERNVTFGGRVQTQILDDKVQIGSTFVHENGSALDGGSKQNMVGVDVIAQVSENTEVRAEYALTDADGSGGDTREAILAEVVHTSERLSTEAYFRQEDGGFGLGQRNSNTNGIRRFGASANYEIEVFEDEKTGRRGNRSIEATAYREENLGTGESRNTGEVVARHNGDRLSVSGGIRASHDDLIGRADRDSLLAITSASLKVPKHGATFQIAHEQPLGGKDEVSAHPRRTTLGVDKTIGQRATASIRHELVESGSDNTSQNTTFGLTATPWTGGSLTAASDLLTNDSGRRLGATVGLDQQIRLSKNWSASAGVRNRRVLDAETEFVEVTPDAAISPFEVNEDFTSAYVGAAYRTEIMSGSARLEARNASDGDTWTASAGIARELSEELSIAGAARGYFRETDEDPNATSRVDVRLGGAWRPRSEDIIIFDRLDISHEKNARGEGESKIVNNAAANVMLSDRWQLTANYGVKRVSTELADTKLKTTSHLLGAETRFDITDKIDLGLTGSFLTTSGTDNVHYSFGPSIGVAPVKNVWISAGYNFEGFTDDDFEAAEYTREGLYLKLRIKFDQNTASGLLRRISPSAAAE